MVRMMKRTRDEEVIFAKLPNLLGIESVVQGNLLLRVDAHPSNARGRGQSMCVVGGRPARANSTICQRQ